MTLPRNLIQTAFPGQIRMQQAFEALVNDAETATANLNTALEAIGNLGDGAEGVLAALADKQPKNAALTSISILGSDPGVLEQIQAGIYAIRPIDTADTAALMTRALADTRYLGGAHAAASATKLATARTITASGDGTWSVTFDGSANVSAALTLATVNANTGTFGGATTSPQFSVDGKGRITGVSAVTITPAFSSITGKPTTLAGYGITDAQPLDGDLTSLAVASGTNTIYYRSAANTWSAVTIGSGLTFAGGTLAASSGVTPAALTKTDDTNVTLTLGGTPATALLQGVSITVGWAGTLSLARGGTGQSSKLAVIANVRSGSLVRKAADLAAVDTHLGHTIAWDQESFDDDAWHDTVTNNTRFTVPTGVTRVRVGGSVSLTGATAASNTILTLQKNGTGTFDGSCAGVVYGTATPTASLSAYVPVVAGDFFELNIFNSSTSVTIKATTSNFWIEAA